MRRKDRSIQRILSEYFLMVSVVILVLSAVFLITIQYRTLRTEAEDALHNICIRIAENIELQVEQMDTIALNAISTTNLREDLEDYTRSGSQSAYRETRLRQDITGMLTALRGMDFSIRQLNIYSMDGTGFGAGSFSGLLPYNASGEEWFRQAAEADGRIHIAPALQNPVVSSGSGAQVDQNYFALYRLYLNNFRTPMGIVEVMKNYEEVFQTALSPGGSFDPSIVVYSAGGEQIFPLVQDGNTGSYDYYSEKDMGTHTLRNPVSGNREYVFYQDMKKSGFVIAAAVPSSRYMQPITRAVFGIVLLLLFLFLLSLLISRYLSRRLSLPIRTIDTFLTDKETEQFAPLQMKDTGVREIDHLKRSINKNRDRQKTYEATLLNLKEKELQAQMLALQSQMNPHFLYNSLSSIDEMAQEGMTGQVSEMARSISEILRYISSNREQQICLEEELELTSLYLGCMKLRYGDDLIYDYHVEDEMLEYMAPKLCIQLLVENAIKSATTQLPPWHITVDGYIGKDRKYRSREFPKNQEVRNKWFITVLDNGPGFDPEVDKRLRLQMDEILKTGILPGLQIEGMGILNIFIRLYLLDGPDFVFDFGNRPEGGAFVTIGGFLEEEKS